MDEKTRKQIGKIIREEKGKKRPFLLLNTE
jgi:hypothetical protein